MNIDSIEIDGKTYRHLPIQGALELGVSQDKIDVLVKPQIIRDALSVVDKEHAKFLRELTGGATDEEQKTWPRKLMAAIEVSQGSDDALHVQVIERGAKQRGYTIGQYAAVILAKDKAFSTLIDIADALRDEARSSLVGLLDTGLVSADLIDRRDEVFQLFKERAAAVVIEWREALAAK